jgi:phosphonate degradation associated HDIG domain protein
MSLTIQEVNDLLCRRGTAQYGHEAINQLEHALQCANLAEIAGESSETIVACLLHDLGHLLAAEGTGKIDHDNTVDDLHQFIVLPFLRSLFPESVLEPIRMHVDAKRYLCLIDAIYWQTLSDASKLSLMQQGGVFSEVQAKAFIAQPYAEEAVRLRRYDDLAKTPGKHVPALEHYEMHLKQAAI